MEGWREGGRERGKGEERDGGKEGRKVGWKMHTYFLFPWKQHTINNNWTKSNRKLWEDMLAELDRCFSAVKQS